MLDEDLTNKVAQYRSKKKWKIEKFYSGNECNELYPQVYDHYSSKLQDSDERVFAWKGIANGIAIFYYFKRKEGKWFLIKVEDLST